MLITLNLIATPNAQCTNNEIYFERSSFCELSLIRDIELDSVGKVSLSRDLDSGRGKRRAPHAGDFWTGMRQIRAYGSISDECSFRPISTIFIAFRDQTMSGLPEPTGPYPVSTLTIEVPVSQPRTFLADRYAHRTKSSDTKPAFRLQTVAVTLYYPTSTTQSQPKNHRRTSQTWLPAPRMKSLAGLLKYASLSSWWSFPVLLPAWWMGLWGARLPTSQGLPLADKLESAAQPHGALPPALASRAWLTALFSPGLAGTATTYSVYCSRIASHGVVVAALDHRDGTSPSSLVHLPPAPGSKSPRTEEIVYTREEEIAHPADPAEGKWHFRQTQLAFRRAELYEAVALLQRINAGYGREIVRESTRQVSENDKHAYFGLADLASWRGRLDLGQSATADDEDQAPPCLIGLGHSFGAATMLSTVDGSLAPVAGLDQETDSLNISAEAKEYERLRAKGPRLNQVALLDPWVEPLVESSSDSTRNSVPPLFAIVSQGFALWSSHFEKLKNIMTSFASRSELGADKQPWLATLSCSRHTDFSDFPFILPRFFASHTRSLNISIHDFMNVFQTLSLRRLQPQNETHLQALNGFEKRWERTGELQNKPTSTQPNPLGPAGVLIRHPLTQQERQHQLASSTVADGM